MTEIEEAKMRHPSSGSMALLERPERSAGRVFLDAIEDLRMTVELHGSGSPQALLARRAVDAARERAAEAWLDGPSAA